MSSIAEELAATLGTVSRPGNFFVSGTTAFLAPRVSIDGIGAIAFPLLPAQAEQLVAQAERAPFGRGEETLIDIEVRRTWQIDPGRIRIEGKHWPATLGSILAEVAESLGVTGTVNAELYKLLIYDQGSFFVPHRDTEKVSGMFATLVLVLPSLAEGGELIVRHKDREIRLDLRCEDPSELRFAAFYADCVHEVLPVTAGYRLALVYNLVRFGKGELPRSPDYSTEQARIEALLTTWVEGKRSPEDDTPEKLVYPLDHAYTPAELGFDRLKGADAAVAPVLVAAARRSDCDLHLALVSVEESGSAEHTGGYGRYRRRSEPEEEYEMGEIFDRSVTASHWCRPDAGTSILMELPIEEEEFSPPGSLDDIEPDEVHFHEATGNEGASFERTYRRAALILWPTERSFAVINQAGLRVSLPYLRDLIDQWQASGEAVGSVLWLQACDLSSHMIGTWPKDWYPRQGDKPTDLARMADSLTRLRDPELIARFLGDVARRGGFDYADIDALLGGFEALPADRARDLVELLVTNATETSLAPCAGLLRRATASTAFSRQGLASATRILVNALPGDPKRRPPEPLWHRRSGVTADTVVDLYAALGSIDEAIAGTAANHMLEWPKIYGIDAVLIPALRRLLELDGVRELIALRCLRDVCVDHLNARIAEPLEPPRDWRRAAAAGCGCPRCIELQRFLADPERESWSLKAAQFERSHIESVIRNAHCDVDTTTVRRGSPHSLVCTKNQASYERRVKQRKRDLVDLQQLGAG